MKRCIAILLLTVLLLSGCSNSNNADEFDGYYQVGETFTVSHSDKVEFDFSVIEFTDSYFTVQISKKSLAEDTDVYIYSKNFNKAVSGDITYDEAWLPTVFPIGVFEVPLKDEDMTVQIYFLEENIGSYQGYVKATIDSAGSSSYDPRYAIKFVVQ